MEGELINKSDGKLAENVQLGMPAVVIVAGRRARRGLRRRSEFRRYNRRLSAAIHHRWRFYKKQSGFESADCGVQRNELRPKSNRRARQRLKENQ